MISLSIRVQPELLPVQLNSVYDRISHLGDELILVLQDDHFQPFAKYDIVVDSHSSGKINYSINIVMPPAQRALLLNSLLDSSHGSVFNSLRDCEASTLPSGTIPDGALHMSELLLEEPALSEPTESKFKKQNPADSCNHEIPDENQEDGFRSSLLQAAAQFINVASTGGCALLIAVFCALTSFIGILTCPSVSVDGSSFALIDSVAFFVSLAWIIKLMHKLPLMLWLLTSVSSIIGAYMCVIMANHPHEVVPISLIGSCVFLAAFLPYLMPMLKPLNCLKRIR